MKTDNHNLVLDDQTTPLRLQHLLKALKQCNPVNEKLLMRLYKRVGCNLN